jgi:hypothetical protein
MQRKATYALRFDEGFQQIYVDTSQIFLRDTNVLHNLAFRNTVHFTGRNPIADRRPSHV